jgi:hypothetical protein
MHSVTPARIPSSISAGSSVDASSTTLVPGINQEHIGLSCFRL